MGGPADAGLFEKRLERNQEIQIQPCNIRHMNCDDSRIPFEEYIATTIP